MTIEYFPVSGRILLTDNDAHVVFDSDHEFLSAHPNDFKTGSQVVPARVASSTGVNGTQTVVDIDTEYALATLEVPGAFVVRGMMRSTAGINPEPIGVNNLWRQATGTHIDILDGVSLTTVPQDDIYGFNRVATMGGYTLYINAIGHLVLRERLVMRSRDSGNPPGNINRSRQASTIEFRILVGFFLGAEFVPRPGMTFTDVGGTSVAASFSAPMNFGLPFAGRRCVVATWHTNGSNAATGCTIGGVAATSHMVSGQMSFFSREVSDAALVPVEISFAGNGIYAVYAYAARITSSNSYVSAVTETAATLSAPLVCTPNQVAVSLCRSSYPDVIMTWGSADYRYHGSNLLSQFTTGSSSTGSVYIGSDLVTTKSIFSLKFG